MPTLDQVREGIIASLLEVPFNRHLGVVVERDPRSGAVRISIPPKPEIVGSEGQHSTAAVFALGDIVSSIEVCNQIAPRALELEMGAIFLTVAARLRPRGPARGTLTARASVLRGLDEELGHPKASKKSTIEVAAEVLAGDGDLVGEQQTSF